MNHHLHAGRSPWVWLAVATSLLVSATERACAQGFVLRNPRPLNSGFILPHGGASGGPVRLEHNDVWEFDGAVWSPESQLPAAVQPTGSLVAFAYDQERREQVVLAASGLQPTAVDTYVRTGATWSLRAAGTSVGAGARFEYHPALRGLVAVDDTADHLWTGSTWLALPVLSAHDRVLALAPDPVRNRLVALCIAPAGPKPSFTLWESDGLTWTQMQAPRMPPFEWSARLEWDPLARKVMLFELGQPAVWHWDGSNWAIAPGLGSALAQGESVLALDPIAQRLRLFTTGVFDYVFRGTSWTEVDRAGPRSSQHQVFDPVHHLLIRTDHDGDHVFDGHGWRFTPGVTPPPGQPSAYDPITDRVVMLDNFTGPGPRTWTRAAGQWSQQSTPVAPSARLAYAMAPATSSGGVLLFGGFDPQSHARLGDTWLWNGQWQDLTSTLAVSPPAGGAVGSVNASFQDPVIAVWGQLWRFSGGWSRITATSPVEPSIVTARADATPVIAGQQQTGNRNIEVWEFRTGAWQLLGELPSGAWGDALLEDPVTLRLHAYAQGDDYVLTATPAADREFGDGCGARAPRLLGQGLPQVDQPDYRAVVLADGGAPVFLAFGSQAATIPLGSGCTQYVTGLVEVRFAVATADGVAAFALPIPATTALRGQSAPVQAAALQTGGPLGGLALSNALRIDVGD